MSRKKKKAPLSYKEAKRTKKPYYERYWWVPWAISGLALLTSIIKPVLYQMI